MSMTRLPYFLLSLFSFALLCVTTTYWAITLFTSQPMMTAQAPMAKPISIENAGKLFGNDKNSNRASIQLLGILSFDQNHAAAIVSNNNGPTRVININQAIDNQNTLSAIQPHSIMIENKGHQTEITLSKPNAANTIYVR